MQGFDPHWSNFPAYIIGITHEIWEERKLATLERYYAPDIVVRMPGGISRGNAGVIASTMATLHEFPDRTLLAEDVIWSGSPAAGMLSSHRIYSTATHRGDGQFGPATGRKVAFRAIADCHARNNVIDDEWLARDQGAICLQLGSTPQAYARQQLARAGEKAERVQPFVPDLNIAGPYDGRGNDHPRGSEYAHLLTAIMSGDIATIRANYDRACRLGYPDGVEARSWEQAETFWMGLRASFPDADFAIHHQIGNEDPLLGARAALRWSLTGKHSGWGAFGPPSGAPVHVMGFAHAVFGPWGLREEWVVIDTTAVWQQIFQAQG